MIYTIGYLLHRPTGAASAIGMVDIHNRLLANPDDKLRFSAVTDAQGGASRLVMDAFTSTTVFVESRQVRDVDKPRSLERLPDELVAGIFPMPDEV